MVAQGDFVGEIAPLTKVLGLGKRQSLQKIRSIRSYRVVTGTPDPGEVVEELVDFFFHTVIVGRMYIRSWTLGSPGTPRTATFVYSSCRASWNWTYRPTAVANSPRSPSGRDARLRYPSSSNELMAIVSGSSTLIRRTSQSNRSFGFAGINRKTDGLLAARRNPSRTSNGTGRGATVSG